MRRKAMQCDEASQINETDSINEGGREQQKRHSMQYNKSLKFVADLLLFLSFFV